MSETSGLQPRSPWVTLVFVAIGVGAALGLGVALATSSLRGHRVSASSSVPLSAQVTWAPGTRKAPEVALRDQHGAMVSLRSLRGHTVALTFIASTCTRECPLEGRVLRDVLARTRRTGLVLLVVSVDPWSDTRATVRAFAAHASWGGTWHWLLGTERTLSPTWRAYHVAVKRVPGDVLHSAALYVIDPKGDLRSAYVFPFSATAVASDVRRLAAAS